MKRYIHVLRDSTTLMQPNEKLALADEVDLFICALGYETRSSFIARNVDLKKSTKIALAFPVDTTTSYRDNQILLEELDFNIVPYNPSDASSFDLLLANAIDDITKPETASANILIDISSMSRPMIARLVLGFFRSGNRIDFKISFTYCPATFSKPNHENAPVTKSEPVIPEFAGWSSTPDASISTVIGLGFEYDWAMGALEHLEPETAWAFVPRGEDERFDHEVKKVNSDLLAILTEERIHSYSLLSPASCFTMLESLIYGLKQNTRPILVPFGPKLFTLICLLVAAIHEPDVTVWRISGDAAANTDNRNPSGQVILLEISMPLENLN